MNWLWSQFQDFAFGIGITFWVVALFGLGCKLWTEPRETARKVFLSMAWLVFAVGLLWCVTQYM